MSATPPAPAAPQPAERPRAPDWLLAVAQLPTGDPAVRMRVLRMLESLGAAVMREGVYVLPDSPAGRQALERLAEYVNRNGGSAWMLHADASSPAERAALERLFDRSARYEALIKTVESLRVGFGMSEPGALMRVLQKQRRDFELIASLDFFPSEARERARAALAGAETDVRELMFPSQGPAGVDSGTLHGRTWATRRPLWADRLASAWLIRRFIDPEATLVWLDKGQPAPPDAVGFAFEGAHFHNTTQRVTFEELLARAGLGGDAALARIAGIVHYLEVQGAPVPEAAGVQTLLQGAVRRAPSDAALLGEAEQTFDLLYDAYYEGARRGG